MELFDPVELLDKPVRLGGILLLLLYWLDWKSHPPTRSRLTGGVIQAAVGVGSTTESAVRVGLDEVGTTDIDFDSADGLPPA